MEAPALAGLLAGDATDGCKGAPVLWGKQPKGWIFMYCSSFWLTNSQGAVDFFVL